MTRRTSMRWQIIGVLIVSIGVCALGERAWAGRARRCELLCRLVGADTQQMARARQMDWRPRYPDRVPLLGEYNEQATMDREIAAAATTASTSSRFSGTPRIREWIGGHTRERVNVAVEQFMNSPQAHRMKFVVEFCNHRPFGISDAHTVEGVRGLLGRCMQHPSYLQVGGRRVFKIHGSGAFHRTVRR